jgi:hypothetical protein
VDLHPLGCLPILDYQGVSSLALKPYWWSAKFVIYFRTSIEAPTIIEMFPAYYIFNFLLLLLLVLHVGWTYLILRIVYNSIMAGQVIYMDSLILTCLWGKINELNYQRLKSFGATCSTKF